MTHDGYLSTGPDGSPIHSFHSAPSRWCCTNHVLALPLETDRRGAAVHEAGHVVAALLGGMNLIDATLTPEHASCPRGPISAVSGVTQRSPGSVHPDDYLTMLAAGEVAHQRWLLESGLYTPDRAWAVERGARDDTDKAIGVLRDHIPGYEDNGYRQEFWEYRPQAQALLDTHWHRVLAVAELLEANGHLSGDEAADLAGLPNPA